MINLNDQLDKVIQEQLKMVNPLLKEIEEGEQKEFLKMTIEKMKSTRSLDPTEFINQFSKIKGEVVDIEKLKGIIKEK